MLQNNRISDQIHLHFIVVILGFTAILGKLITLPALELTTIRMFFASLGLGIIFFVRKGSFGEITVGTLLKILMVGIIVATHWTTFFLSIKLSNVSVALACFSATTLFTSFLEPFFEKRKVYWVEVLIGLVIIVGLGIIFQFETHYYLGMMVAIFSAFLASLFSVFNRQLTQQYDFNLISLLELTAGFLFLLVFYILTKEGDFTLHKVQGLDLVYLIILGIVCTSYAFTATIELMRRISAFRVNLTINLEPIYGIVLAFLIFGESEKMSGGFYIGAIIVFMAVFAYPYLMRKFHSN